MMSMQTLFDSPRSESTADKIGRILRARIARLRTKAGARIARRTNDDPDEPFALVGAPVKPRTPLKTLKAAAKPELP
jgi:hypothetical protein